MTCPVCGKTPVVHPAGTKLWYPVIMGSRVEHLCHDCYYWAGALLAQFASCPRG